MVDIKALEEQRAIKEKELKNLEKEIADARLNDVRIRFNMVENKYYKVADSVNGTYYFLYTSENIQAEYNTLTIKNSIYKNSSEIGFKDSVILDLSPKPTTAINDTSSLLRDLFSEKTLKLYSEDSLKIEEVSNTEIDKLKVELIKRAERFWGIN